MFLISIVISLLYLVFSILISIDWIYDISCYLTYPLAVYLVVFIALIPGFIYMFTLVSLLFCKKDKNKCETFCDVTILIPVYNAKNCIKEMVESIKKQKYYGNIYTIIIDDGSTDESLEVLKSMNLDFNFKVLELGHKGKSFALNEGLKHVKTDYFITLDSDTVLHPFAVKNIMNRILNGSEKIVATAGSIFAKNAKKNMITKMQQWDYTLGIFGVKLYQNNYDSTLVAQGAFSAYKTYVVKSLNGWKDSVGEDIILTWEILCKGFKVNFAKDAVAFTEVPKSLKGLSKQRKRWARGMIEAFKKSSVFTSRKLNYKSRTLMLFNLFFPFIDLALIIFIPLGLIFLCFKNQLLIGWLTLLVILLGLILCLVIEIKRKNMFKKIECELERRSTLGFIIYILFYAFILAPSCLIGYISELVNVKKKW